MSCYLNVAVAAVLVWTIFDVSLLFQIMSETVCWQEGFCSRFIRLILLQLCNLENAFLRVLFVVER